MLSILFINILKLIAISIGAGASTVLVAQSLIAVKDNKVTPDEQNLLGVVMLLIRLAILLLFLTQSWLTAIVYTNLEINLSIFSAVNTLTWALLGILFIAFVFIDYGVINRQLGVSIQLSTWYSLVFVWGWPLLVPLSLEAFLLTYIIFTFLTVFLVKSAHSFVGSAQFLHRKPKV